MSALKKVCNGFGVQRLVSFFLFFCFIFCASHCESGAWVTACITLWAYFSAEGNALPSFVFLSGAERIGRVEVVRDVFLGVLEH